MVEADWRVAIVVDPALPPGLLANTVAVIGIGLGAAAPALAGEALQDAQGWRLHASANRPVPVLQADARALRSLAALAFARTGAGLVVPFPAFARAIHAYADYAAQLPSRDLSAEPMDGLGLAGPAGWVRSLTGALRLLR